MRGPNVDPSYCHCNPSLFFTVIFFLRRFVNVVRGGMSVSEVCFCRPCSGGPILLSDIPLQGDIDVIQGSGCGV